MRQRHPPPVTDLLIQEELAQLAGPRPIQRRAAPAANIPATEPRSVLASPPPGQSNARQFFEAVQRQGEDTARLAAALQRQRADLKAHLSRLDGQPPPPRGAARRTPMRGSVAARKAKSNWRMSDVYEAWSELCSAKVLLISALACGLVAFGMWFLLAWTTTAAALQWRDAKCQLETLLFRQHVDPSSSSSGVDDSTSDSRVFSDEYNRSLFWGTYQPDLYFGTASQEPQPLYFGLAWWDGMGYVPIRHEANRPRLRADHLRSPPARRTTHHSLAEQPRRWKVEEEEIFVEARWDVHDGRQLARKFIRDRELGIELVIRFLKSPDGQGWSVEVDGQRSRYDVSSAATRSPENARQRGARRSNRRCHIAFYFVDMASQAHFTTASRRGGRRSPGYDGPTTSESDQPYDMSVASFPRAKATVAPFDLDEGAFATGPTIMVTGTRPPKGAIVGEPSPQREATRWPRRRFAAYLSDVAGSSQESQWRVFVGHVESVHERLAAKDDGGSETNREEDTSTPFRPSDITRLIEQRGSHVKRVRDHLQYSRSAHTGSIVVAEKSFTTDHFRLHVAFRELSASDDAAFPDQNVFSDALSRAMSYCGFQAQFARAEASFWQRFRDRFRIIGEPTATTVGGISLHNVSRREKMLEATSSATGVALSRIEALAAQSMSTALAQRVDAIMRTSVPSDEDATTEDRGGTAAVERHVSDDVVPVNEGSLDAVLLSMWDSAMARHNVLRDMSRPVPTLQRSVSVVAGPPWSALIEMQEWVGGGMHAVAVGDLRRWTWPAVAVTGLRLWRDWLVATQCGGSCNETATSLSFRWRSRNGYHLLASGLDDYPRLRRCPEEAERHVDLFSWVHLMTSTLSDIERAMGVHRDDPLSAANWGPRLTAQHWDAAAGRFSDNCVGRGFAPYEGYVNLFPLLTGTIEDPEQARAVLNMARTKLLCSYGLQSLSNETRAQLSAASAIQSPGTLVSLPINWLFLRSLRRKYISLVDGTRRKLVDAKDEADPGEGEAQKLHDDLLLRLTVNLVRQYDQTGRVCNDYDARTGQCAAPSMGSIGPQGGLMMVDAAAAALLLATQ